MLLLRGVLDLTLCMLDLRAPEPDTFRSVLDQHLSNGGDVRVVLYYTLYFNDTVV